MPPLFFLKPSPTDPELYDDNEDEDDAADDWDLLALRRRAEEERDQAERTRIEALGGRVADLSLERLSTHAMRNGDGDGPP